MIQERTAKSALKKIIGEHELARQGIKRRTAGVVVSHRQTARIRPRGVAIILAAIDLHLVLVEAMPQIMRNGVCRQRGLRLRSEAVLDGKWRVWQPHALLLRDNRFDSRRGYAAPSRRQHG